MHAEAYAYVQRFATDQPISVVDLGGRDINGTCRPLFPNAAYTVVDRQAGASVDIVADAATWTPDRAYDLVVCTEVLEHTPAWPAILATAFTACKPGGRLVVTCAGPGRQPHSGVDGEWRLHPGEHYANIQPAELRQALEQVGFTEVAVDQHGLDVRATAAR